MKSTLILSTYKKEVCEVLIGFLVLKTEELSKIM
jgi:hypothetical protein